MGIRIEGVYAVTPDSDDSAELVRKARAVLAGGVRLLQYRNKSSVPARRVEQAAMLAALCREWEARLVFNDDPALAALCGADGVHLGMHDASIGAARRVLGPERIIGVSCYASLSRALQAQSTGADYVAFGSFFPSTTKAGAPPAPLSLLPQARALIRLPIVAIGGITAENAAVVVEAGADAVAVVNGLFGAADIESAARRLREVVAQAARARDARTESTR
ncbi:MAG TPA: thiamine phosphate synthase [Burkholderiales bacterium]|jgi:thiamine-phosphate pyrophosphorylase|nr:thiamine phosphate synthase [Burkholderiales bacterium]